MNNQNTITPTVFTARDFPIPYPNQDADSDLCAARQFLRIVESELERSSGRGIGMPQLIAADMLLVMGEAFIILDRLQELLDHDDVPTLTEQYRAVRRAAIVKSWEVGR